MENKYLKCFCFTLLMVFWISMFSGLGVYMDLISENPIRSSMIKIIGGIFILFIIYFQNRQIFNACLFLLSIKKRNFQLLWKYFVFICIAFVLIAAIAWLSKTNLLKESASWIHQWLFTCFLYAFSISVYEEIVFRGLLAVYFKRYFGEGRAILFSAITFMLVHLDYSGLLPLITVFFSGHIVCYSFF